jgi:hypothetical protein
VTLPFPPQCFRCCAALEGSTTSIFGWKYTLLLRWLADPIYYDVFKQVGRGKLDMLILAALVMLDRGFHGLPTFFDGHLVYTTLTDSDHHSRWLLIDSGSPFTSISSSAANKTATGPQLLRLDLGFKHLEIAADVRDGTPSLYIHGRHVDGVLGTDLLSRMQLIIDYGSGRLYARIGGPAPHDLAANSMTSNRRKVPLDVIELASDRFNLVSIPYNLGAKTLRLTVDTGAGITFIHPRGLLVKGFWKLPSRPLDAWNGAVKADWFLVGPGELAGRRVPWIVAATYDLSTRADGAIAPFWLSSGRVLLDFPGRKLFVPHSIDTDAQENNILLGLSLMQLEVVDRKLFLRGDEGAQTALHRRPLSLVCDYPARQVEKALRGQPSPSDAARVLADIANRVRHGTFTMR